MAKKEILDLVLEREPFDKIANGEKPEEYREYKPHWKARLEGRHYSHILFRDGHLPDSRRMLVKYRGVRREGRKYVISLGEVVKGPWRPRG